MTRLTVLILAALAHVCPREVTNGTIYLVNDRP